MNLLVTLAKDQVVKITWKHRCSGTPKDMGALKIPIQASHIRIPKDIYIYIFIYIYIRINGMGIVCMGSRLQYHPSGVPKNRPSGLTPGKSFPNRGKRKSIQRGLNSAGRSGRMIFGREAGWNRLIRLVKLYTATEKKHGVFLAPLKGSLLKKGNPFENGREM